MTIPKEVCDYEYDRKSKRLKINCIGCIHEQSIEDSPVCMESVLSKILEVKGVVTSVSLAGREEMEYPFDQTQILVEIAKLAGRILEKETSYNKLGKDDGCTRCYSDRFSFMNRLISRFLGDPIGAYVILKRYIRRQRIKLEKAKSFKCKKCYEYYIGLLENIKGRLESTELISLVEDRLAGYELGERAPYREVFKPTIRPNFMLTRYMLTPPEGSQIDQYGVRDTTVSIYDTPGVRYFYHTAPPEFNLSEEKYSIVSKARKVMSGHKPKFTEFAEPERMRKVMKNIGMDMVRNIANRRGTSLSYEEMEDLSDILARYTAGFGILEVLLADPNIQDIYVNSPIGKSPIYILHSEYEECETNLIPTMADAKSWATRFRILSGRALDESNPVLDTRIEVPGGTARVAAITKTLSPYGLGFAIRRHRERPWTFPLFIKNKMISPLAAGLLSFLIDGGRTILVGGTRSSGKTSFLSSMMLEIMRKYRVIVSEDTLELPVKQLNSLGYNIERLKTRSVITQLETELPAEEGIRTALRLGDSCLIIGEVRGEEAKALFEAMRIGAMANVVAGTIHGESAYAIWDRVVHDLGVPNTSFKAIDIVAVCNMLKSPSALKRFRRVVDITEVRKHWTDEPSEEGGFVKLMDYVTEEDKLTPTDVLLNGDSLIINSIMERVRDWRGDFKKVWDNINLRARIKQGLVDYSEKFNDPEMLEASFVVESNEKFHLLSNEVKEEIGVADPEEIYSRWENWVKEKGK